VSARSLKRAAIPVAALCLGAGLSLAQQAGLPGVAPPGGTTLSFGIASTLSHNDNFSLRPNNANDVTLFDHRLSFGLRTQRRNDSLELDLGVLVRALDTPGRRIDDRTARLAYNRVGVRARFDVNADYRFVSVNADDPLRRGDFLDDDDPIDDTDLTRDSGDRTDFGTRLRFDTGVDMPLGFGFDGRYRGRRFSGTTDADLFDTDTLTSTGTLRFAFSPVSQGRVVAFVEDYSADDIPQTDRRTYRLSFGLTQELSRVDTLDAEIGVQRIDTDETIGGLRSSERENGIIGSAALTRQLVRGTIATSFDLRESRNGRTATWLVTRVLELPSGGIEASAGLASDVSDTLRPVGSLRFTHEMKRSELNLALEREVTTSSRDNELQVTRASLGYRYEINELSDVDLDAEFAQTKQAGGPATTDRERLSLRAAYNRAVTRDWNLSAGYEFRLRAEDGLDTATSNEVFLTVSRRVTLRP